MVRFASEFQQGGNQRVTWQEQTLEISKPEHSPELFLVELSTGPVRIWDGSVLKCVRFEGQLWFGGTGEQHHSWENNKFKKTQNNISGNISKLADICQWIKLYTWENKTVRTLPPAPHQPENTSQPKFFLRCDWWNYKRVCSIFDEIGSLDLVCVWGGLLFDILKRTSRFGLHPFFPEHPPPLCWINLELGSDKTEQYTRRLN